MILDLNKSSSKVNHRPGRDTNGPTMTPLTVELWHIHVCVFNSFSSPVRLIKFGTSDSFAEYKAMGSRPVLSCHPVDVGHNGLNRDG